MAGRQTGRPVRALAVPVALVAVVVSGCGGGGSHATPPEDWHASTLPTPSGTRAVPRDATYCGSRWYVVGATETPDGRTRPAVWSSPDASRWQTVRLDSGGDYYAAREILASVGCSRGRVAVVGAKPGGAHGMPRTATWRQRGDGSLVAVHASFVLYGGANAVHVGRIAGGAPGWLISGTRTSGAAVWRSATARSFRIEEGAPGLASTPRTSTQGFDAAWQGGSWWVVGTSVDDRGRETGMSWTPSGPRRWLRLPLPTDAPIATAECVTRTSQGLLAVGLDGDAFGAWRLEGGRWSQPATFGEQDPAATEAAYVAGLASAGGEMAVAYSDGGHFRLAMRSADGAWRDLTAPEDVSVSGDRQLTVAGGADRFLVVADDGSTGRVWVTGPVTP